MIAFVPAVVLAAAPALLGCGWIGINLAYPAIELRGDEVKLGEPLRVVGIDEDSPAAHAGLLAGTEILAVDGDRWDGGAFIPSLVRLQTVEPGDTLTLRVRDEAGEREATVQAVPCDARQSRRRAELVASLGWMQGAALGRDRRDAALHLARLDKEEARAYDEAVRHTEAAIAAAERRMHDPEIRARIQEAIQRAEDLQAQVVEEWSHRRNADLEEVLQDMERVQRDVAESWSDPEVVTRLDAVVAAAERARRRALETSDPEVTARIEELVRRAIDAQAGARQHWNSDEAQARLEEMLRQATEAQIRVTEDPALQERLEAMRIHLDELRRQTEARLDSPVAWERLEAARRALESVELDQQGLAEARRLAEEAAALAEGSHREAYDRAREELERQMQELRVGKPDHEAMRAAREEVARVMEEVHRHREAMRDAQRFEAERIQRDVQRALVEARRGRAERRVALLHAARAAERRRRIAPLFRGAQFEVVGPGLAGYVGVDHGLLVAELEADAPLAAAGVRAGDVILSVEGRDVGEVGDLFEAVADRATGLEAAGADRGTLQIEVQNRDGRRSLTLTVESDGPARGPL